MKKIDRKDFFKVLGAAAVSAGLQGGCGGGSAGNSGAPERPISRRKPITVSGPQMAVARGPDPEAITRAAVEALGGINLFVSRGDKVLIKPNIGWDRVPAQATTTNPQVVKALAAMCLDAGAGKVVIMDNTINDPRRCYVRSGIKKVAEELGVEIPYAENYKFKKVNVGGELIKQWPVYSDALEMDKIINVPVAKHHSASRLTIGMKNLYGLLGGRRNQLHQDIHLSIAEMTAFFAPSLTVVDAVRILLANGPSGGSLSDVKKCDTVIVSVDPVAADAKAAELFDIEPAQVAYLVLGSEMGLGTLDPSTLELKEISL